MKAFTSFSLLVLVLVAEVSMAQTAAKIPVFSEGIKFAAGKNFSDDALEQHKLMSESFKINKDVECAVGSDHVIPGPEDILFKKEMSVAFTNKRSLKKARRSDIPSLGGSFIQIGFNESVAMITCRSETRNVTESDIQAFMDEVVGMKPASKTKVIEATRTGGGRS